MKLPLLSPILARLRLRQRRAAAAAKPWTPLLPPLSRRSRLHRITCWAALLLLLSLIAVHAVVTYPPLVRWVASSYLSTATNARVDIESASLSIFDGLALHRVTIYAGPPEDPSSRLVSAGSLVLQIDPWLLLAGAFDQLAVRATDINVSLVEDPSTGQWNYQRLISGGSSEDSFLSRLAQLPRVELRNVIVDYSRLEGGRLVPSGQVQMAGRLFPTAQPSQYAFDLQARSPGGEFAPAASGRIDLKTGQTSAKLSGISLGPDMRAMLPSPVSRWWDRLQLNGKINIPEFSVGRSRDGTSTTYRLVITLQDGTMLVPADVQRSAADLANIAIARDNFNLLSRLSGHETSLAASLRRVALPDSPFRITGVDAHLVLTDKGIQVVSFDGSIEGIRLAVAGTVGGYDPGSPMSLRIFSPTGTDIEIAKDIPAALALPLEVREVYERFKPSGRARFDFAVVRPPGGQVDFAGQLDILSGSFAFERFPYPVTNTRGVIAIVPDTVYGGQRLELRNIVGYGPPDSPNADKPFTVNGHIGPLSGGSEVKVVVVGQGISSDPYLARALPPGARRAVANLGNEDLTLPEYHGNFECRVARPRGPISDWTVDVDIDVLNARGALKAFPYPLENVHGRVLVREGRVLLENIRMIKPAPAAAAPATTAPATTLALDGEVAWSIPNPTPTPGHRRISAPTSYNIAVAVNHLPLDATLRTASPPAMRQWLDRLAATGTVDLTGRVSGTGPDYHFQAAVRDGSVLPAGTAFAVNDIAGSVTFTESAVTFHNLSGRRAAATITAGGQVQTTAARAGEYDLTFTTTSLTADDALRELIPPAAQKAFDDIRPTGAFDGQLRLFAAKPADPTSFDLTLRPQGMSATLAILPYRLDNITGQIRVTPTKVTLTDLRATRDAATITASGTGIFDASLERWSLAITADSVAVTPELVAALPVALADTASALGIGGTIGVSLPTLEISRPTPPPAAPNGTVTPSVYDTRYAGTLNLAGTTANIGAAASVEVGSMSFSGQTAATANPLQPAVDINAELTLAKATLGGRPMTDARATLIRRREQPGMRVFPIEARLANGTVAGDMLIAYPPPAPDADPTAKPPNARYELSLAVRNADAAVIAGPIAADSVRGSFDASVNLSGEWADPATRRGRGDVRVAGKNMARIPLLLGVMQVANLSLPTDKPFSSAQVRYNVEGPRIRFESISIRSPDILMEGTGLLDLEARRVNLSFYSDDPRLTNIPVVGDIVSDVRRQMMQIQIKGSIDDPKFSVSSFDSVTTTVDEVLNAK